MWIICLLTQILGSISLFIIITVSVGYLVLVYILKNRSFKNIAGDVAVVTGGGHGLGRCIALQLASRGCHVAIADINFKGAEETVSLIKSQYEVKCKAYKVDVSSLEQVTNLNGEVTADLGLATIVINNAAILLPSDLAVFKVDEIQRMLNVNLMGYILMNHVFIENMKSERKGHIVAISSIASFLPLVYNEVYGATKSGVHGLMRTLRLKFKFDDCDYIHTTTVFPSYLSTNSDVIDISKVAQFDRYFTMTPGDDAARIIVHGMLRNEIELFVPRIYILYRFLFILPAPIHDLFMFIATNTFSKTVRKLRNFKMKGTESLSGNQ